MKIAGKTDIGMVRKTNQDAFRIAVLCDGIGFALVCDGMGGVNGGDQASAIARKTITAVIRENIKPDMLDDELHDLLLRAIFEANRNIFEQAQCAPEYTGMGTTVLAAIITPPDIASQVMVALPMVLLFQLGIVMSALCEKTKKKTAEAEEE